MQGEETLARTLTSFMPVIPSASRKRVSTPTKIMHVPKIWPRHGPLPVRYAKCIQCESYREGCL